MAGKIQGPGGLGQWDTGTANRDIRANVSTPATSQWVPGAGLAPQPINYARPKGRKKGRSKTRSKRR